MKQPAARGRHSSLTSMHRFLIIGGAEKAGTTSLYTYLAAHPEVCASSKKETDFFRRPVSGIDEYLQYFEGRSADQLLNMESSPGYLAEASDVAPRVGRLLPEARWVFVLRDPVARLRSSFRFYKSRLHVPDDMSFDTFIDCCFDFMDGKRASSEVGIAEWHLNSISRGRYEQQMREFQRHVPGDQIMLVDFESFGADVRGWLHKISAFAGIRPNFYDTYAFERENASFLAKHRLLQRTAILINDRMEGLWRRYPRVKKRLRDAYKVINERPLETDELSMRNTARLADVYRPTLSFLTNIKRQ